MSNLDEAIKEARAVREMLNREPKDVGAIVHQCRIISELANSLYYSRSRGLKESECTGQLLDLRSAANKLLEMLD